MQKTFFVIHAALSLRAGSSTAGFQILSLLLQDGDATCGEFESYLGCTDSSRAPLMAVTTDRGILEVLKKKREQRVNCLIFYEKNPPISSEIGGGARRHPVWAKRRQSALGYDQRPFARFSYPVHKKISPSDARVLPRDVYGRGGCQRSAPAQS